MSTDEGNKLDLDSIARGSALTRAALGRFAAVNSPVSRRALRSLVTAFRGMAGG